MEIFTFNGYDGTYPRSLYPKEIVLSFGLTTISPIISFVPFRATAIIQGESIDISSFWTVKDEMICKILALRMDDLEVSEVSENLNYGG